MFYRFVKRGFDIFNSSLALIILAPIFLFVSLGIKISSKGPVFYVSERIGKGNTPFKMYKFRSMHIRQEGSIESKYLVNEQRIFRFGKFIRKSKLDELPQLINILVGDMSIIGPRPYPKKFTEKYFIDDYSIITMVRPGLSCLDSLYDYAHGELFVTDEKKYARDILPVRTELARIYIERRSISLDIYCIIRTIQLIYEIAVLKRNSFKYTAYEKEVLDHHLNKK